MVNLSALLLVFIFYASNLFAMDCKVSQPKDGYIKISDECREKGIYSTTSLDRKKYSVKKLVDNSTKTAWVEGVKGNGIGEEIFLDIDELFPFNTIKVFPGYGKSMELFKANSRPKEIELTLLEYDENKNAFKILKSNRVSLLDEMKYQGFEPFTDFLTDEGKRVPEDDKTYATLIEIISVYSGTKHEDLAISEIESEDNSFYFMESCPGKAENCVILNFSYQPSEIDEVERNEETYYVDNERLEYSSVFAPIDNSSAVYGRFDGTAQTTGGQSCVNYKTAAVGPQIILTKKGKYRINEKCRSAGMGAIGYNYSLVDINKSKIVQSYPFLRLGVWGLSSDLKFYIDEKKRISFKVDSKEQKSNCLRIPENLKDEFAVDTNCKEPFKQIKYKDLPEKIKVSLKKTLGLDAITNCNDTLHCFNLSPDGNYIIYDFQYPAG